MKTISLLCLFVASVNGAVYTTDTSNDYLSAASFSTLNITNQITMCLWISRNTNSSPLGGIIAKGLQTGPAACQYNWGESSGGGITNTLEFFFTENNKAVLSQWRTADNAYVNDNVLTFIAMTFDYADSSSIKMYVNGSSISGSWVANTPTGVGPTNFNGNHLQMGMGRITTDPCGGGNRWTGYYSEIAIWSNVLTFGQLELIRKSKVKGIQKQINSSGLRLYLSLDSVPDNVQLIPQGSAGASEFPDRQTYGPKAYRCASAHQPIGRGESICSYQPNE